MLRIPRKELNLAIEGVMIAAAKATDTAGLRVLFALNPHDVERVILATLSILAPVNTVCTAADVVFFHTPISTDPSKPPQRVEFPPSIPGTDHKREEEKT